MCEREITWVEKIYLRLENKIAKEVTYVGKRISYLKFLGWH